MVNVCPKCQYQRTVRDSQVHKGICPRCGIAYTKYRASGKRDETVDWTEPEESFSLRQRLWATLMHIPEQTDATTFWGRTALLAVFALWGGSFILGGIDWQRIGGSFMHNVNLPFHEFGHVLFGFFGRFMGILGGSLFQVLLPLIFVFAFSVQMHDNYAAAICLWWCGQSFIDLSPYIADAPHRALPLILGMGEDYHDWGNLLTMTNAMDSAQTLATVSFTIGSLLIVLAILWAGRLLQLQYHQLS